MTYFTTFVKEVTATMLIDQNVIVTTMLLLKTPVKKLQDLTVGTDSTRSRAPSLFLCRMCDN
ncbi:MAG TPA: hypothetical protein VLX29_08440 [Nitrospirota bacterium]|nr:hypothetical protein [Nitrospirota bacterium]